MREISQNYFDSLKFGIDELSQSESFLKDISYIANLIIKNTENNKLVVIYGNGGSAADAQHFSAELIGTFKNKTRRSYKALALNTDTSFLTAWANDFEFSSIFERQIDALSSNIGLSIGLSTSGRSKNVLRGLTKSNSLGIHNILISGINCPKYDFVDKTVRLPSSDTSIVQTFTQIMYHLICISLEEL